MDFVICNLFTCQIEYLGLEIEHISGTFPLIFIFGLIICKLVVCLPNFFVPYLFHIARSACSCNYESFKSDEFHCAGLQWNKLHAEIMSKYSKCLFHIQLKSNRTHIWSETIIDYNLQLTLPTFIRIRIICFQFS